MFFLYILYKLTILVVLKYLNYKQLLMKKQLKQPNKYTHSFLRKKSEGEQSNSDQEKQEHPKDKLKTKQIDKDKYVRKVINKPDQPSAIRLEQINKTFNNLSQKSESFIANLQINQELLKNLVNLKEKFVCDCHKNIKYYCLKCSKKCLLLNFPSIKLPLNIHIVHHVFQKINKSSVAPMKLLSDDISFYQFEGKQGPQNKNKQKVFDKLPKSGPSTYILYPHKNSKNLKQITHKIEDLIVLDCTWFQTDQIIENMQQLGYTNYIKLQGYQSVFWRYNHYGQQALSSAESLMHFFRQYQLQNKQQAHKYDSLMLLYALNLTMVGKSMIE